MKFAAADGKSVAYSTYLGALGYGDAKLHGTTPRWALIAPAIFVSNIYGPDAPATLPSVSTPGYGFLAKLGPSNSGALVAAPSQMTFQNTLTQSTTLRNMGSAAVELQRPFCVELLGIFRDRHMSFGDAGRICVHTPVELCTDGDWAACRIAYGLVGLTQRPGDNSAECSN